MPKITSAMNTTAISLATVMLLSVSHASAQKGDLEAGVHLGPSFGWLRGNIMINATDPLLGAAGSVSLYYGLSQRIGVRAAVAYQGKGMFEEITLQDAYGNLLRQVKSRNAMDYLMVPVMAQASFGNKARIQVGVGPYAGMLLRSRRSFGDEVNFPTTDTTNELKQWDMGISASLGGSLPLTDALRFEAMVRYDKGLSNISALPVFGGGTIHTNAVCLLLGCSYRLTRTDRPG